MKRHNEEQTERLRSQLEEANNELLAKDKELKKLKLQELMKDTQQSFANLNTNNLNHTVRHATTYVKKAHSGEVPGVEIEHPQQL